MKKTLWIVLILAVLIFFAWTVFRPPTQVVRQTIIPPKLTNALIVQPAILAQTVSPRTTTNDFLRPNNIDEEHWNQLMLARQLALSQNQPVEFYARVLDQNDRPVEGARLSVKLTRNDEKMFETTNFFSRQMGDEVLVIPLELFSDSNGWISLTGTNGYFLDLWSLTRDGYSSSYPGGNFAGVHYKPGGVRTPTDDILMTNSWNSGKGFVLHLQKNELK